MEVFRFSESSNVQPSDKNAETSWYSAACKGKHKIPHHFSQCLCLTTLNVHPVRDRKTPVLSPHKPCMFSWIRGKSAYCEEKGCWDKEYCSSLHSAYWENKMFHAGANKPGEDFHDHKSINICLNEKRRRKNAKWKKKPANFSTCSFCSLNICSQQCS